MNLGDALCMRQGEVEKTVYKGSANLAGQNGCGDSLAASACNPAPIRCVHSAPMRRCHRRTQSTRGFFHSNKLTGSLAADAFKRIAVAVFLLPWISSFENVVFSAFIPAQSPDYGTGVVVEWVYGLGRREVLS